MLDHYIILDRCNLVIALHINFCFINTFPVHVPKTRKSKHSIAGQRKDTIQVNSFAKKKLSLNRTFGSNSLCFLHCSEQVSFLLGRADQCKLPVILASHLLENR